jgi:hypothetical protein
MTQNHARMEGERKAVISAELWTDAIYRRFQGRKPNFCLEPKNNESKEAQQPLDQESVCTAQVKTLPELWRRTQMLHTNWMPAPV